MTGQYNVVADTLSRPNSLSPEVCSICNVTIYLPTRLATKIRIEQLKYPEVQKIINSLEDIKLDKAARWCEKEYAMTSSVLYRYSAD